METLFVHNSPILQATEMSPGWSTGEGSAPVPQNVISYKRSNSLTLLSVLDEPKSAIQSERSQFPKTTYYTVNPEPESLQRSLVLLWGEEERMWRDRNKYGGSLPWGGKNILKSDSGGVPQL